MSKKEDILILKGTIVDSDENRKWRIYPDHFLVCKSGICEGIFKILPEQYQRSPVEDFGDRIMIPGFTDLHVHASQYGLRGFGMDLELLDWLNTYTFAEEAKYENLTYARKAYSMFVEDLKKSPTTRACIFATIHPDSTVLLMELLEESGLITFVGKVNMDRNSPENLCEKNWSESILATKKWVEVSRKRFKNTMPILTPRFTPSCTNQLMEGLGELMRQMKLPVQSHLSENKDEIAWVKELCPKTECYGDSYDQYGLFGSQQPAVMAHAVYSGSKERKLMKDRGTFIAHCPQSNVNLCSGIAPVRAYLEENQKIGLGTDVAGGASLSMFRAMTDAIQMSKLYYCYVDRDKAPLTAEDVFWMATRGGGEFFGKTGCFEKGFEADILVLSEEHIPSPCTLTVPERLERIFYLAGEHTIQHKYVKGNKLF